MAIKRKIAVVGTARAGKTVFLTSLINHLDIHKKTEFAIGETGDVRITNFEEVPMDTVEPFKYRAFRSALVYNGRWPEKTCDSSHFICKFGRSDWRWSDSQLHFFDLPGERIADAKIAEYTDYAEWSDYLHDYITSEAPYRQMAKAYLDLLDGGELTLGEAVHQFKIALAEFTLSYKTMISPSTFLLGKNGSTPKSKTRDEFLNEVTQRHVGLEMNSNGQDGQFAPLPKVVREKHGKLSEHFAQNYECYRKEVVLPIYGHFRSCHRMIVLVDIPSLLNGGVSMFNDNYEHIKAIFEALKPKSFIYRLFSSENKIDRVAFVATKRDLVHPSDLGDEKKPESDRLIGLLLQMTESFKWDFPDIDFQWFTCSAIESAEQAHGEMKLRGKPVKDNPEREDKTFSVSKLPEAWAKSWQPGDYHYHSVHPRVPPNKLIAPAQTNLNDVFTFISKD